MRLLSRLPEPAKALFRPIRNRLASKTDAELRFWKRRLEADGGTFGNGHYERLMLGMAGEQNADFLADKVVADFGCGPRGSLAWIPNARMRVGIDVLADRYADEFTNNVLSHNMIYLKSTEHVIPLPTQSVDVIFTLNAIDHVDYFEDVCGEIIRVLRSDGLFIGSFNLEENASLTEPQRLTERRVTAALLDRLDVEAYRISRKSSDPSDPYEPFFTGNLSYTPGERGCLWVRARKR